MACLSPSPSGRRLSELLEEQQEPFSLDLHLLEKGCSSRLLDGSETAMCWPVPANDTAAAVIKRLTSKKNTSSRGGKKQKHQQQQQPTGLLKLLLSKILHGKATAGRKNQAALQFSDSFKTANPAASEVKDEKKEAPCSCSDSDWDSSFSDDDEKQLSPVSVLDHPFETCSPVHGKLSPVSGKLSPSKNAVDVFRDLLDAAAYSPALLSQLLAKSDDPVVKATAADEDDEYCYGYLRTSPKNIRRGDAAYWEARRAELARVSELVAAEVPNARLGSGDLLAEREDVGAGVAAALFESLLQELAADLGSCGVRARLLAPV